MRIDIDRVTKVFQKDDRSVTALRDFSLAIAENELVTVVGASGCGKTTLLNAIGGLEQPTGGEIRVGGRAVRGPSPQRGVIFQQYALFPWLTVKANVEFGLKLQRVPKRKRRQIARQYLDLVGLSEFEHALPKELSGGMKQRCAIARAYAVDPAVLLMDEPFGALDSLTRVQLQDQLLTTWEKARKTIFFITHDVEEAVYLSSRVIVMAPRGGRIKEEIGVDLPYPRTPELRLSPRFVEFRNQVWTAVHHNGA